MFITEIVAYIVVITTLVQYIWGWGVLLTLGFLHIVVGGIIDTNITNNLALKDMQYCQCMNRMRKIQNVTNN